jgi:hypothetical protein
MGVSGALPNTGVVGIVVAGVFEEDRVREGNDTVRLAILRPVKFVRPRDCARTALVRDDVGRDVWVAA